MNKENSEDGLTAERILTIHSLRCLLGPQDDLVGTVEYVPDAESRGPWPDLVGKSADEAKEFFEKSFPDLKVVVMNENSMMTMDYRIERVRIMVNDEGVVTKVPHRG